MKKGFTLDPIRPIPYVADHFEKPGDTMSASRTQMSNARRMAMEMMSMRRPGRAACEGER